MDANPEGLAFSIKLWPPSQTTRLLLVERMANNLSTPSIFTRKYGSLSKEEVRENAKQIELYAKECSKLILEVLKRGPITKVDGAKPTSKTFNEACETVFDISKGQRAFVEAEEAEELLRPLKEPGNSYTKICFSNRSFGLGAARVAEPILASLKDQLKEVDLSDFIAGRSEGEALEVMAIFSEALEGCVLKSLNLSNNALEEAARAVCELIPATEKLRVLQFHNNMTGDEGALAISEVVKQYPMLEDFRCSSTRIGSDGGVALSEALQTFTNLKNLDLRDNMFDLTEAYLSYLNLEDEGAVAIANVLKESASALKVLEMAGNDITAEAAPALAACIVAKQLITKLNLADTELRNEGAIQISKALEDGDAQLKGVDLSSNFMRRAGVRCLTRAVVHKPRLKLLNMNGNFIFDEGIDEVKNIFNEFPNVLRSLDENDPEGEDDNEFGEGEDERDELESKLKNLEVHQED
ncbi:RAN GTPase-activating protein 2 [Vitis vinifera]|uniref:RAN GTPase-activating protein 2 n=1 Tax=Vitis vinifera TaxID=29760 RepID=A0A438GD33_VITVI|nr:RAN GTPase-activating protein 2 [Vitis vinifera]